MAKAAIPTSVTAQKVARQPKAWPSQVPKGTPRMLAMVSPVNISGDRRGLLVGRDQPVATTEPTPKKVPWAKAVSMRAPISVQ